jgi:nucleolar protein 56
LLSHLEQLYGEKEHLVTYIEKKMATTLPNVAALAGSRIGAQLLSHAGSIERLSGMPSSTLQLLGAETALFRHLKNRKKHRPPKYGLLFNHPLVQKVPKEQQGKAARALADKLSICAKVDRFEGEPVAAAFKKLLAEKFTAWE